MISQHIFYYFTGGRVQLSHVFASPFPPPSPARTLVHAFWFSPSLFSLSSHHFLFLIHTCKTLTLFFFFLPPIIPCCLPISLRFAWTAPPITDATPITTVPIITAKNALWDTSAAMWKCFQWLQNVNSFMTDSLNDEWLSGCCGAWKLNSA